jgi:hypothetical protein
MQTYQKGIIGIKINKQLNLMLVEKGEIMDYTKGVRMRHYRISLRNTIFHYTETKRF